MIFHIVCNYLTFFLIYVCVVLYYCVLQNSEDREFDEMANWLGETVCACYYFHFSHEIRLALLVLAHKLLVALYLVRNIVKNDEFPIY